MDVARRALRPLLPDHGGDLHLARRGAAGHGGRAALGVERRGPGLHPAGGGLRAGEPRPRRGDADARGAGDAAGRRRGAGGGPGAGRHRPRDGALPAGHDARRRRLRARRHHPGRVRPGAELRPALPAARPLLHRGRTGRGGGAAAGAAGSGARLARLLVGHGGRRARAGGGRRRRRRPALDPRPRRDRRPRRGGLERARGAAAPGLLGDHRRLHRLPAMRGHGELRRRAPPGRPGRRRGRGCGAAGGGEPAQRRGAGRRGARWGSGSIPSVW